MIDYARIALLVFVVLLFPAGFVTGCSQEKSRFDAFKDAQEAIADAQRVQTLKMIEGNKTLKEKTDAENSVALAALAHQLRDIRSRPVSAPAACPGTPAGAARFSAESAGAYRDLVTGLRAEAERCSKAVIDLNGAKHWAQSPK